MSNIIKKITRLCLTIFVFIFLVGYNPLYASIFNIKIHVNKSAASLMEAQKLAIIIAKKQAYKILLNRVVLSRLSDSNLQKIPMNRLNYLIANYNIKNEHMIPQTKEYIADITVEFQRKRFIKYIDKSKVAYILTKSRPMELDIKKLSILPKWQKVWQKIISDPQSYLFSTSIQYIYTANNNDNLSKCGFLQKIIINIVNIDTKPYIEFYVDGGILSGLTDKIPITDDNFDLAINNMLIRVNDVWKQIFAIYPEKSLTMAKISFKFNSPQQFFKLEKIISNISYLQNSYLNLLLQNQAVMTLKYRGERTQLLDVLKSNNFTIIGSNNNIIEVNNICDY